MQTDKFDKRLAAAIVALLVLAIVAYLRIGATGATADMPHGQPAGQAQDPPPGPPSVALTDDQLKSITVGPVSERDFPLEKESFGSIDFNEDMAVQVFTPYQGRIIQAFAELGDDVKKGEILFTIESPDLIQAESTLIAAAGVRDLTTRALARAKELYAKQAASLRRTRAGGYPTSRPPRARYGPRATRCASSARPMPRSTHDRDAARRRLADRAEPDQRPGHGAQRRSPACSSSRAIRRRRIRSRTYRRCGCWPTSIESDSRGSTRWDRRCSVSVMAFPGRVFTARSRRIGATASIPTSTACWCARRSPIPAHELRPGMFASFVISTGAPVRAPAVAARRRGARGRRHDDRLGHHRPPPLHPADGQDRLAAGRLRPDRRGSAARRAGRHRRRAAARQHRSTISAPPPEARTRCEVVTLIERDRSC